MKYIITLCFLLALFGCGNSDTTSYESPQSTVDQRSFFNAYKDSLISVEAINAGLNTEFKLTELGRPIGVSGTPYWLITIGGWQLNNRNILLQGTAFRLSSEYYPNPARKTEVEFEGPFTGLIRYNEVEDKYSWLFPYGNIVTGFKYQGTQDYDLIVLNESEDNLDFLDIATQRPFSINGSSKKILDWSLDKISNSIVVLFSDSNGTTSTSQFQISTLLTLNSTSDEHQ